MLGPSRFSQISSARQALVRLCQSLNFGRVERLIVRAGEPFYSPPPLLRAEIKLDSDEPARPELELADFDLRDEIRRLLARLDELQEGTIERIDVRAGIPQRVVIERRLREASL